jgi:uncharacterized protein (TIGR03437 family)
MRRDSIAGAWILPRLLACLWAGGAWAGTPAFSLAGVVNAASFLPGVVAPGQLVTIFGSDLGPAEPAGVELASDRPHIPTRLAETRVWFDAIAAPLLFASSGQVTAVVPLALRGRPTSQVRVEYEGVVSEPVTVLLAKTRPGVFTVDGGGLGQAAALNWPAYSVNAPASPAARGSIVMVYATAGGWAATDVADSALADAPVAFPIPVAATIGDVPAAVLYAGTAPGLITGVLQVNLRIPDCAPAGDRVPLVVAIDGVRSQPGVTIAVRGAGPGVALCSPYAARASVYRGQLHCHTTASDGLQDPATLVRAYRDAGYAFVAISDHERVTPDPGVPGILTLPGIEQAPEGKHLNRIGALGRFNGGVQDLVDRALAEGDFVIVNHPNWPGGYPANPNWSDADFAAVGGFHAVDVWNAVVAPYSNAEGRIDDLLSQRRRLFLTAVDDCHNLNAGYCMTGSTWVFADRLDAGEILRSLKAGNFYASNGARISAVRVAGTTITLTTDQPATIDFIALGGRVVKSVRQALGAAYTAVGNEIYVRCRVTRDADGRMAWTNPIYVER